MNALLSESPATSALSGTAVSVSPALVTHLDEVEFALLEARNRILSALDRELAEVRSQKSGINPPQTRSLHRYDADLPANVLPIGHDVFALANSLPLEASVDPALERATIEELNAALEAAFSQMTR